MSIYLRKAGIADAEELQSAFERSADFIAPWAFPPEDIKKYIEGSNLYLVCLLENNDIVGSYRISEIVRGFFHSAYLGYQAFVPFQGKGYMGQGLKLLLKVAFGDLNLHRLEANIQPGNEASIKLVEKAGFKKEGVSPNYLRVGGTEWKDHERWAIINHNWIEQ